MANSGGWVFPLSDSRNRIFKTVTGITRRNWLAGELMPAVYLKAKRYDSKEKLARRCYEQVDALIKEGERTGP